MPGCHLYCSACRLVLLSHFNRTKLFNDDILFQEYTPFKSVCLLYCLLHNQVSLSSYMSIKTGLFFFLTFWCIIIPISGIIDHYRIRLDLKIVRLPSPDRPNSGCADSKYFIGPLKAKFF